MKRTVALLLALLLTCMTVGLAEVQTANAANVEEIKLSGNTKQTVYIGMSYRIVVPDGSGARYKSSNVKVAKVSGKGVLTLISKGDAKITVTLKSGKKLTLKLTVKKPEKDVELSGYIWKKMSSVAKKIGGMKKHFEVLDGSEWYSYKSDAVQLYTLGSYDKYAAKTCIINISKKSKYTLKKLKVGMTKKELLKAAKSYKRNKSYEGGETAYAYSFKIKEGYPAILSVQMKKGVVTSLVYSMVGY